MKQIYKVGNAIFTENKNKEIIFEHFSISNNNKTNAILLTFTKNTDCVDFTLSKDKMMWEFL